MYVGDELAATVTYVKDQIMYSFSDLGLKGSVITIRSSNGAVSGASHPGKNIDLSEVEVYTRLNGKY